MSLLAVKIVTPEQILLETECDMVVMPGTEGEFGIMKNHVAILATLAEGKVKIYQQDNISSEIEISGGVCQFEDNKLTILAEKCL